MFTVVIPTYRPPGTLATAIDSVLAQTLPDFEVIVVDDGSGDQTPEWVAARAMGDSRIRLIEQENAGTAAARNTGVAAARGTFVSLLDHDDAWVRNYLESALAAFTDHPEAGMAYADAWPFDDETGRIFRTTALGGYPPVEPQGSAESTFRTLLAANFITASSVTLSRRALDAVGPFHTRMSGSDDWDMWLRVTGAGFQAVRAGTRPLVMLREHPGSQSKNDLMMFRGGRRVIAEAAARLPADGPEAAIAAATAARLDTSIANLDSSSPLRRRLGRARTKLARVGARMLWRHRWLEPTPEVLAAFPPLRELQAGSARARS